MNKKQLKLKTLVTGICLLILISCHKKNNQDQLNYEDQVTIYRDEFGVPHIYGENDASAAFGFAYAQAEDNFSLIEENYISSIGRSSELIGEKGILDDWLNRALEISELSKNELSQLSPEVQAVCEGYAAGLNYYVATHPEVKLKLLEKFEAWHPLAFIRYLYYQRVLLQYYANIPQESFKEAYRKLNKDPIDLRIGFNFINKKMSGEGSNSWAVNGTKSSSGYPLLFINPHLSFFGHAQVYEAHIMSETDWNFTGYTRFGFPFPYVGFGEELGWASTDNKADLVDTYLEFFDDKKNPLNYKYDGDWKSAKEWKETIQIKNDSTKYSKELTFLKTHHGPVISIQNDKYVSAKMAKYEDSGWLEQWYLMTKANNLKEFKSATERLDVQFGNYLYADVEGNILYVYNGAIPKRSEKFDWSKPVDGSNPETEWQGYHSLNEIPQVFNPSSGWIQNCNGTPLLSSDKNDNPKAENYPNYMIPDVDNNRSKHSRIILGETSSFTFESFLKKSYSTYLLSAEKELPQLFQEVEKFKTSKLLSNEMQEALTALEHWDYNSSINSIATTVYLYWSDNRLRVLRDKVKTETPNIFALNKTLVELKNKWNTWQVPWGDINRLQRVEPNEKGKILFDDTKLSLPIAGAPSWTGSIFAFNSRMNNTKKRYGSHGNSYVSVIEFAPKVKAKSLHYFGTSGNPKSKHYFDQSEIYSRGDYKQTFLNLEDVKANAKKAYKPCD